MDAKVNLVKELSLFPGDEEEKVFRTKVTNSISLILFLALFGLAFLSQMRLNIPEKSFWLIGLGVLSSFPILLNRFGWDLTARIWLSAFMPFSGFILSVMFLKFYPNLNLIDYLVPRLIFIGVASLPLLLMDERKEIFATIACSLVVPFILFINDPVLHYFGLAPEQNGLIIPGYEYLTSRLILIWFIVVGGVYGMKKVARSYMDRLALAGDRIRQIKDELEILVDERTRDIREKNKKLIKFTHYHSHMLRKPVSNLQGLMELVEGDCSQPDIMDKVQKQCRELDKLVYKMNHILAGKNTGEIE